MQKDFVSLLAYRRRTANREGAEVQRVVSKILAKSGQLRNEQADEMRLSYPYWEAGKSYVAGEIVTDPANGQNYIVMQDVTGTEHQPPHGDDLLDLYRPIPRRLSDGTFIFVYGQNVFTGDPCRDSDGVLWVALKDMLPCVWPPAEGNEWRRIDTGSDGSIHAD